ncbi:unnamed protein product [Auanema sp. JU1783]|nr:unnamed protein product [Auanema sp. JU1783]
MRLITSGYRLCFQAIKENSRLITYRRSTTEDAVEIATRLTHGEQKLLRKALEDVGREQKSTTVPLTTDQCRALFWVNAIPFIAFGFLDNMIMIFAGEFIDQKLGVYLCISTMAAAALGNLVSDVAGVGLAHYVEILVNKAGIKHPALNPQQLESNKARCTTHSARALGLSLGCIIGMFPLLFYTDQKND